MKRAFVLLAIFFCSVLPAMATPAKPARTYEAEKARLIAAGYEPAKMRRPEDPQRETCINGFCDRYPEVYSCREDRCFFVFKRQRDLDILLVVTTKGAGSVLAVRPPGNQDVPYEVYLDNSAPLYPEVRARLIAQGYKPVMLRLPRDDEHFGITTYRYHKLYPETLDCAMTGIARCIMAYVSVRTGAYMTLRVFGEIPAEISAPYPVARAGEWEIKDIKSRLARGEK